MEKNAGGKVALCLWPWCGGAQCLSLNLVVLRQRALGVLKGAGNARRLVSHWRALCVSFLTLDGA